MSRLKSKSKFLKLYFLSRFFSHPTLNMGTIFVTRRCDRNCIYCYTKKNVDANQELSTQESKEVIDKFNEFGVWYLAFYGGEPTLRSDLADNIRYANNKGMFTIVHTNGSFKNIGIDEVVNAGIDVVDIAIDSITNPALKNYSEVKEKLERLIRTDVGVKLNHCITKENCDETTKILWLTEHYKIPISIHLGESSPLPTNINYDSTPFFKRGDKDDIQEVEKISRFLADRSRKSKLIINPPEYFEVWSRFIRGENLKWECKAGKSSLCIDYNGVVLSCVSASSPINLDGNALYYKDLNKSNINNVKQKIKESTLQCSLHVYPAHICLKIIL
ncbi:MAG: radical SAM protein [Candidatus Nanoarchaeia archaeon]|nr:radical SAM protein [Candidatus Nanoarchaeia archaeon]